MPIQLVIERFQAFEKAGADVLFAPGIEELGDIESVVTALEKPVSVLMSTPNLPYGLTELQAIGVRRVSIGSSMAQLIYGNAIKAVSELAKVGTYNYLNEAMGYEELEGWFSDAS